MRLLLAEDEKILSKALVTILKHNNYSVDAVYNGEDAITYLESGIYDGAILDIMMPKCDGLTVLKTIRDKNITIPVIMLTAKSETEDKCLGLDLGADDYLTKPFEMKELLSRIRAMTRRKENHSDNVLEFNDLTLDRISYEMVCNNTRIKLNNKEFQMLEILMLNPKRVVSTEKFLEKIWGYDTDSEINVVWVYISYLRKKLKDIQSNVFIKASRNIGYSLEIENV